MTDTMSPITGPLLTPMFATGSHPKVSNTQPHAAPVFDTGPHPEPLRPLDDAESGSESPSEPEPVAESDPEPQPESVPVVESEPDPEPEPLPVLESHPEPEPQPEPVADASPSEAQLEAQPQPQPQPQPEPGPEPEAESPPEPEADGSEPDELQPFSQAFSELENVDTDSFLRTVHGHSHLGPVAVQAQPVLVPGSFLSVKRWQFALITAGVWVLAAAAGLGFYYWWYTSLDKTVPVFGILLYMAVCAVAAILVTMVPNRPQVTALAIALMAAPMASTAAAAVLHGAYYFEWIARPVMGPVIG